jgi:pimeloyl-ACP methyl ester carboxylesterase
MTVSQGGTTDSLGLCEQLRFLAHAFRRSSPGLNDGAHRRRYAISGTTCVHAGHVRVSLQAGTTTPWLELIRQRVPAAQIEIISDVGHFTMLDAPEAVNRAIAAFAAELPQT